MSEQLTFAQLLRSLAARQPDSPYLISSDSGRELSCGRLWQQCQHLGRQFKALGLDTGDKVSVYMPNGELTAVLLLGIMANGLVANPINLMCQHAQLKHVLDHSDTRLIFTSKEQAGTLAAALREVDRDIRVVECDPASDDVPLFAPDPVAGATMAEPAPDDPALLMYTSGTTGVPKGVLHSHDSLIYNGRCISEAHRLTRNDRVLGSLPLYHINGLVVTLIAPLVHEGSVVMTPRFSAASFWTDASRFQCTWINVVPTIISYLLNDGNDRAMPDLSRLRFCRSASSALAPEHHRAFENRFGIGIIETMGLTETAAPAFSNPIEPEERRIGSIGTPSGMRAMVITADGKQAAPQGKGEIILHGRNVMLGYYKDPERTRETFTDDGWLKTGDIGYQDEQGYFYVTGRAKELIIKGGENIAPREIDEAVIKHPNILEAAAVGVPHPDYGQDIAVYLVLRDKAAFDGDALRRHCLSELGKYKTPSKYVVVDELPRGPSGKVQRLKLLELGA
ncbi:AMP-binding protein [Castellaniella sp.]|uniref:AMP-binding protein n=1 Tax=Castellaniella sp. TaxID=1955812 RepID=UPI003C72EF75